MVRRKDRFWEHAEESDGGFKCKFCKRCFSGGIPRIKSHLAGIKGRGIDICTEVPEDIQADACLVIGNPYKKSKTMIGPNLEENQSNATPLVNFSKGLHQSLMPKMSEKNKSMVDRKLVEFLLSNNIAFDVVETHSFAEFVRGVAVLGPDYKLPCIPTLQTKFVPEFEMEIKAYLKRVKESLALTGCTIMLERLHNLVIVIASSQRGALFMNSYEMSKHKKVYTDIGDIVSSVIEDIGVDHVVQFITNDTEIFNKVGDLIINKHPKIYKVQCIAHQIHSLLNDIYNQLGWVQLIIDAAKLIVECMYEDAVALALRKYTNKELKHPCMAKFASNYQMLQSVFDNKHELWQLIASAEWRELILNYNKERAIKVTDTIRCMKFWTLGEELLQALEPIIRVLCLVEDDRATSGYIYEAMDMAKEAIMQLYNNNKTKYEVMVQIFEDGQKNIIHPIHAAAAFLNPAYMSGKNFMENQEMKAGICFVLKTLVADEEKNKFMREVQLYRNRISYLFTEMAMEILETTHPWAWWDYCGDHLPVLRKYAIRILSQPCKCSCQHKVSAFEVSQTKKMSRVPHKMQDNLVHLTMNIKMMGKFRTLEAQCLEPIDIGNCNELPEYVDFQQDWANDQTRLINVNIDESHTLCSHGMANAFRSMDLNKAITLIFCVAKWYSLSVRARRRIREKAYAKKAITLIFCVGKLSCLFSRARRRTQWKFFQVKAEPIFYDRQGHYAACFAVNKPRSNWVLVTCVMKWLFLFLRARRRIQLRRFQITRICDLLSLSPIGIL